jgi:hypothetical protein
MGNYLFSKEQAKCCRLQSSKGMTLGDFDDIAFFTLPFLGRHPLGFFGQLVAGKS